MSEQAKRGAWPERLLGVGGDEPPPFNCWYLNVAGHSLRMLLLVDGFGMKLDLPADTNEIQANRALATALRTLANKVQRYTPGDA